MKLLRVIEFLRNRLTTVVRAAFALLAVLVLIDAVLVNKEQAHTRFERIPAFWSIFGFVGCVVIILASKWFGHAGIMTREDYYNE